jgi:hemerythrin
MKTIEWEDEWNLGNSVIDKQHKTLVNLINGIISEDIRTKDLLQGLIDYTAQHFADEEQLMFESGYDKDKYKSHKIEHKQITKALLEISFALVNNGDPELPNKFRQFCLDWFVLHFLGTDKQFGEFLKGGANVDPKK